MLLVCFALSTALPASTVWGIIGLVVGAFVLGLLLGAQITSHEERALNYNLEDVELDELHALEAGASAEAKSAIAKLKAAAAYVKRQQDALKSVVGRHI